MAKVFAIGSAYWKDEKLHLKIPETDDIRMRRHRAKEVLETYKWRRIINGVCFKDSLEVWLLPDRVGCVCPDIKNRQLPCKHIFAAAARLGDTDALLKVDPPPQPANRRSASEPHRKRSSLRPQDIRVGKYFLLCDFLFSDTAAQEGIRNWVDINTEYGLTVLNCMGNLCDKLLDPLCEEFGRITITRGYLGQQVYARLYARDKENWVKGALAHGFQEYGGADIHIHTWEGTALELAKHIQAEVGRYSFDFIRTYPESSILCVGVGMFKNRRNIVEWHNNFAGSTTYRP